MRDKNGRFMKGHSLGIGRIYSNESKKRMSESHIGKKLSQETKKKLSIIRLGEKNSFFGKKHSIETRKRMSDAKKGVPNPHSEEHNKKIGESQKGKKLTEEHKKKISIAHIGKKHSIVQNKNHSLWMINNPNKTYKDTSIEIKIEKELCKRNISYKKQVSLCNTAIVDFLLPETKTIIQCDGCYYHNCPTHKKKYNIGAKEKDNRQDITLRSNGFKVYRFWEHEINKSPEECINKLML